MGGAGAICSSSFLHGAALPFALSGADWAREAKRRQPHGNARRILSRRLFRSRWIRLQEVVLPNMKLWLKRRCARPPRQTSLLRRCDEISAQPLRVATAPRTAEASSTRRGKKSECDELASHHSAHRFAFEFAGKRGLRCGRVLREVNLDRGRTAPTVHPDSGADSARNFH